MLVRIAGNGVRTIIVETAKSGSPAISWSKRLASRCYAILHIALIVPDSPTSFLDDGPTSKLVRQILGAVSEFDKVMIVAKLKGARDRIRRERGKCEGRKRYA